MKLRSNKRCETLLEHVDSHDVRCRIVNKMAKLTDEEKRLFPLKDIDSVVKLFQIHLRKNSEPNLAILSIILGYIENTLTCAWASGDFATDNEFSSDNNTKVKLPSVDYSTVEALHERFLAIIKAHVDVTAFNAPKYATRELVKRVSDVVWCTLSRSYYKDRAHLQSIYSYMTGAKLDCYGTTLAVVAACQALGYSDVHMALSEDHTWVVFGPNQQQTVEVTWHGKGNEDKRGIPVSPEVYYKSWLYVNGMPVVCNRHLEVATMVSNMNPGINATTDSEEVTLLQQALLWLLYDSRHLTKYPMSIDNLADLEELVTTKGRPSATELYKEAIVSARRHYRNQHVYPYTYLGGYYYRNKLYKQALKYWAKGASVIKNYNYSRDDEEIYKEFLEIANELIPHIMRVVSAGISARSILKDPECFAYLLAFYDGICQWEEGSATPVLHIGWAKALFNTIAKFDADVRCMVKIRCRQPEDQLNEVAESETEADDADVSTASHDQNGNMAAGNLFSQADGEESSQPRSLPVELWSAKMRGLRELLLADRLNSQAISLQLTAQSQVMVARKRPGGGVGGGGTGASTDVEVAAGGGTGTAGGRSKRSRRE